MSLLLDFGLNDVLIVINPVSPRTHMVALGHGINCLVRKAQHADPGTLRSELVIRRECIVQPPQVEMRDALEELGPFVVVRRCSLTTGRGLGIRCGDVPNHLAE